MALVESFLFFQFIILIIAMVLIFTKTGKHVILIMIIILCISFAFVWASYTWYTDWKVLMLPLLINLLFFIFIIRSTTVVWIVMTIYVFLCTIFIMIWKTGKYIIGSGFVYQFAVSVPDKKIEEQDNWVFPPFWTLQMVYDFWRKTLDLEDWENTQYWTLKCEFIDTTWSGSELGSIKVGHVWHEVKNKLPTDNGSPGTVQLVMGYGPETQSYSE